MFFFCIASVSVFAKEKTICLNMIVKDEKEVIERCLNSVKGIIDYWVIVDTGSKDGTQEIIKKTLKDIPGKLYERPWVNFGHNRTEALGLAKGKGDYLLFIDADEQLVFSRSLDKSKLEGKLYMATLRCEGMDSKRALFVSNRIPGLKYVGILHECLEGINDKEAVLLDEVVIDNKQDGNRSKDPAKYAKDAQMLEEALKNEPLNSRYVFYLAQCYLSAGEQTLALKNYEKRVAMGTKEKAETYWSLLMIGEIQERLKYPPEDIIDSYCKAYQYLPTQAEPLLRLASYFLSRKNYMFGYFMGKIGMAIPRSKELVFSYPWVYDYGLQSVVAECCFNMGKYDEAFETLQGALNNPLPPDIREQIIGNLNVIKAQMQAPSLPNL